MNFTDRREGAISRCSACGLSQEEHIAGWWCPDALDDDAMYQDEDDPKLLINILYGREHWLDEEGRGKR